MKPAQKGTVYLVGAGPGDPDLLTMRAASLLQTADVVLHDGLISQEILDLVHPGVTLTNVGKLCGRPKITQAGINALMIELATTRNSVVRLKSGDPLVFGRAGEEIAALRAASIPFEIVPGVTAALAAGAVLGLPLTDRASASKLIFCTASQAADKIGSTPLWTGPIPDDATLVIYMPGRDLARIASELADAHVNPDMPCCAISHIATPRQTHISCRLISLATLHCGPAPLLLLIGRAMESLLDNDPPPVP
ncbi:MAG: uroporphyrinogen-III C-methyltransferase [Acidobacteria bacterium]|nr:uroporphyrinogen-III C-methyltransferase [Acidobacteriota bacterium]